MVLKIYFLRHGETAFSKTGDFCGWVDEPLTAEGKLMAEDFATAYGGINWAAIYSSPMKRTVETARPVSLKTGVEIQLREGLKEINYGKWELKSHAEIKTDYKADYDKWVSEPGWNSPTDGETAFQIAERSCAVIQEALAKHADGAVLFVSHKATIRIMLCSLLGIELGRYRDRVNALTGSVSLVTFDQHGPRLDILGDRNHLREELRIREGT